MAHGSLIAGFVIITTIVIFLIIFFVYWLPRHRQSSSSRTATGSTGTSNAIVGPLVPVVMKSFDDKLIATKDSGSGNLYLNLVNGELMWSTDTSTRFAYNSDESTFSVVEKPRTSGENTRILPISIDSSMISQSGGAKLSVNMSSESTPSGSTTPFRFIQILNNNETTGLTFGPKTLFVNNLLSIAFPPLNDTNSAVISVPTVATSTNILPVGIQILDEPLP